MLDEFLIRTKSSTTAVCKNGLQQLGIFFVFKTDWEITAQQIWLVCYARVLVLVVITFQRAPWEF